MNTLKILLLAPAMFLITDYTCKAQYINSAVTLTGQMKNVMWKGELGGNIYLDTISGKQHLYGLGPVEYLAGEILIIDGKSYRSTVVNDSIMKVDETYKIKAPFFGYAHISKWTERVLPDSIQTIKQLEQYLIQLTGKQNKPFLFKLTGTVETASIHIVNLPKGSKVTSPEEAHQGQINYPLVNTESEIIGFFSKTHQAIFTHHDTYLHMHLITTDRKKMGHLDKVVFKNGSFKLYLPAE